MNLKISTYNLGFYRKRLGTFTLMEPIPNTELRVQAFIQELKQSEDDILCLQEVFHSRHRDQILNSVSEIFPFHFFRDGCGLLLLSKIEIQKATFIKFLSSTWIEKLAITPGYMLLTLQHKGRQFSLINLHFTAGGLFYKHTSPKVARIQSRQVEQILQSCEHISLPLIVAGDFNSGKEIIPETYNKFIAIGLNDPNPNHEEATFHSSGNSNIIGRHGHIGDKRIDHVLFDHHFELLDYEVFGKENMVKTPQGYRPISDHYGFRCYLKTKKAT